MTQRVGPHRLVVIVVGAILALPFLFTWIMFSEGDTVGSSGGDAALDDLAVGLAVPIMAGAAFGALWMLATRLDLLYRYSSILTAATRLLAPGLFAGFFAAWVMNKALFGHGPLGFWTVIPGVGLLVGPALLFLRFAPSEPSAATGEHQPTPMAHMTTPGHLAPDQPGPTAPPLTGLPVAPGQPGPTAPPLIGPPFAAGPTPSTVGAFEPTTTQPLAPVSEPRYSTPFVPPPAAPPSGPAPAMSSGGAAHLVTSIFITVGWIPLGFIVWFLANYCPNEGEGQKTLILSTAFVFGQLLVNAAAGPLLYHRFRGRGGVLLAIGRSVVVAVAALIVGILLVWLFGSLIGPHGRSVYCG